MAKSILILIVTTDKERIVEIINVNHNIYFVTVKL